MEFKNLKRKIFFWVEKLQISKKERLAFSFMLVILAMLFLGNLFLNKSLNYDQEQYEQLLVEFEKRSAQLEREQNALEKKYNPALAVNEPSTLDKPTQAETQDIVEVDASVSSEPQKAVVSETELKPIDINLATSAQLQTLNGIGPTYAQRIIEYREANNGFDSIDELLNVRGIGPTRLNNIRPLITIDN